jgi:hypothetical protein
VKLLVTGRAGYIGSIVTAQDKVASGGGEVAVGLGLCGCRLKEDRPFR